MAESHQTGKKGEEIAVTYLTEKGYDIMHTNWQSNHQEVDIIARQNGLLVFVEVKARRSAVHGSPEVFVTMTKQKRLIKAANHYLAKHHCSMEVRFDIISIVFHGQAFTLNHIRDAFQPTVR